MTQSLVVYCLRLPLYGNGGNDTIVTRTGNDIVYGGNETVDNGIDTLDYSEINNTSNVGINANLNIGIVILLISILIQLLMPIPHLQIQYMV